MNIFRNAVTAVGILAISAAAHAQGGYWGLGASSVRAEDEVGDSIRPTNLYAHVGYDFNEHFGVEGQSSFTLLDDSFDGVDWSTSIVGIYAKGAAPVSEKVSLYVLGGFSSVEVSADLGFGTASDDESGPSYGVGADFAVSQNLEVFVRYMNYLEEDGLFTEVTAVNVGVGWSF